VVGVGCCPVEGEGTALGGCWGEEEEEEGEGEEREHGLRWLVG
jgi:hypothetical protein